MNDDWYYDDCEDGLKFLLEQLGKEDGYEEEIKYIKEREGIEN